MSNLEIALQYHARGLSVIPLWSPAEVYKKPDAKFNPALMKALAENNSSDNPQPEADVKRKVLTDICKTPLIYTWSDYQKRMPSNDEITRWFTDYTEANIGIVTGEVSGIIVIDIDSDDVFDRLNAQGKIPSTVIVKTGKGYHLYMRHPGFKVGNKVGTKVKIDIRGNGGYSVTPPSVHGSGASYEWVTGHSIFDNEPANCLPWMLDYINGKSPFEETRPVVAVTKPAPAIPNTKPAGTNDYADLLASECPEGQRNQTATRLIGHLLGKGLNPGEVWTAVSLWNKDKCIPPITEDDLYKTFTSITRLESMSRAQQPKIEIASFLDTAESIVLDYTGRYVRIPFGRDNLQGLEKKMNDGLLGGNLYVLGGIPSSCKTGLANNIADNICLNGYPVLFFSLDDTKAEIRNRTFARFSRYCINQFNTRVLSETVIRDIANQPDVKEILSLKYVIENGVKVESWKDYITAIQEAHKKTPVIIVDYLKKLRSSRRTIDERLRIEDIVMKLTSMAKEFNIPVIVISELARDSYKSGQRLSMGSFKESGSIEYESSWLGILAAVEDKNGEFMLSDNWENIVTHDGNIDLIIFKSKRGTGDTGKVPLKVNRDKMLVTVRERPDNVMPLKICTRKKSKFE